MNTLAGELAERFTEYQQALKANDAEKIAAAAEGVYLAAESLSDSNANYAVAALNYGKALTRVKKLDQAETYLQKSLESHRKVYGEDDPRVIDPLLALAGLEAIQSWNGLKGKYRTFIRESLELAEKLEGKDSLLYANVALEAGKIALERAKDSWAISYLQPAYDAFSGPHRQYRRKHFFSAFYLGKYYLAREQFAAAEPMLADALQVVDSADSGDSTLEMMTRAFLVKVYEEMGDADSATEQAQAIGRAKPFDMNQEPEPLFRRTVEYPPKALKHRQEGYAVARFTITDTGLVEDIEIIEYDGSEAFGEAVIDFLEEARFAPRFVDGQPVSTADRKMKFSFNLAN
nr:TonB family protein [Microbulbifer sediminum]